jgi:hypothetical protein
MPAAPANQRQTDPQRQNPQIALYLTESALSNSHKKIPNSLPKRAKTPPQSLFRLERHSTLYFQQLTKILIEPMFRLERRKTHHQKEEFKAEF